ncbi:MobA/MobL family protein [Aurantiacibacter suaedae]|uniref:MobA/MobL family protein n=1 Tax=Aurantiacibacter suaedae TaxID=2545755 RepID=UPI0010F4B1CE|nr:MobA/MobL family protein [Aurantiacibacter suaedae]
MPTNAQMEARNEFEAACIRIKLKREGLLEELEGKAMSHRPMRSSAMRWDGSGAGGRGKSPDFHIPAARQIRHRTPQGVTSFHFAHTSITKVTYRVVIEGKSQMPGAARAHGLYIERESAVADVTLEPDRGLELVPTRGSPPEAELERSGATPASRTAGDVAETPPPHTRSDRRASVNGPNAEGLQGGLLSEQQAGEEADHEECSPASEFDNYLIRPSALAVEPSQSRALVTTIDDDDEERAEFWKLVEKHERTPGPDKMVFRHRDHPEFWDSIAQQPDCPSAIREKLAGPSRDSNTPIKIGSGKKVRAFLRRQNGWVKADPTCEQPTAEPPMAEFKDGRGGRVQYRINGELPDELSPAQNFALLKDFAKEFEKRAMPFVAVMHAPDHHNDDRNWHFHLAYSDRPARRITPYDIDRLAREGFDVAGLAPGQWDFTVRVPTPGRTDGRTTAPLKQNKVSEVSRSKEWPKKLRVALANVTNYHLALAGVGRRVSPDSFKDIGIIADPHEHLGTAFNAKETKGVATPIGIENETKQWKAVQAQATARYQQELEAIESRFATMALGQSADAAKKAKQMKIRENLERAARLRLDALLLHEELERSASRARMIRERNLKLLKASQANPQSGSANRMAEYQRLIGQATRYLVALEESTADEMMLAARWQANARRCEEKAKALEAQMEREVTERARTPAQQSSDFEPPQSAQRLTSDRHRGSFQLPNDENDYMSKARRKVEATHKKQETIAKKGTGSAPGPAPVDKRKRPPRPAPQMPSPGYDFGR